MDTFFATAANKRCPLEKANLINFDPCDLSKELTSDVKLYDNMVQCVMRFTEA